MNNLLILLVENIFAYIVARSLMYLVTYSLFAFLVTTITVGGK